MAKRDTLVRCILQGRGTGEVVREKNSARHPGRREKQVVSEVSCWPKFWFGTPEEGKASSLWGELLLLVVELHPGRRGKQGVTEVSCHYIIEK